MAVSDVSQKYGVILRKFKNLKHQNILAFTVWLIVPITLLILQNCLFGRLAAKISNLHFRPFWSNVTIPHCACLFVRTRACLFFNYPDTMSTRQKMSKQKEVSDEENEGSSHFAQCSNTDCKIWTPLWIAKFMPLKYLQDDFLCGFCSSKTAKRVKALESEVEELKKMISPENTKSISAPAKPTSYSEILKNLKSEEREQKGEPVMS